MTTVETTPFDGMVEASNPPADAPPDAAPAAAAPAAPPASSPPPGAPPPPVKKPLTPEQREAIKRVLTNAVVAPFNTFALLLNDRAVVQAARANADELGASVFDFMDALGILDSDDTAARWVLPLLACMGALQNVAITVGSLPRQPVRNGPRPTLEEWQAAHPGQTLE